MLAGAAASRLAAAVLTVSASTAAGTSTSLRLTVSPFNGGLTVSFAFPLSPLSLPFPLLERIQRRSSLLLGLRARPRSPTLLLQPSKLPLILPKMLPLKSLQAPPKMLPLKCPQPMLGNPLKLLLMLPRGILFPPLLLLQ